MTKETINFLLKVLEAKDLSDGSKSILENLLKTSSLNELDTKTLFEPLEGNVAKKQINSQYTDCRLTKLTMSGFRTYPQSNKPYGISLVDENDQPCSLFLIGSNGTGKSTLFAALELYYTGMSSLAKERHVDEEKFLSYAFKDSNGGEELIKANLYGNTDQFKDTNLSTSAFFCSSYDVQKIEESADNLNNFILSQLGYEEILQIEQKLTRESERITQNRYDIADIEEEKSSTLKEVIDEYQSILNKSKVFLSEEKEYKKPDKLRTVAKEISEEKINDLHFAADWKKLKSLLVKKMPQDPSGLTLVSIQEDGEKNNEIEELLESLAKKYDILNSVALKRRSRVKKDPLTMLYERYFKAKRQEAERAPLISEQLEFNKIADQRSKDITNILAKFSVEEANILNKFVSEFGYFIEKVLKYFSEEETYEIKSDDKVNVNISIKDNRGGIFSAKPNEYLNSFRFVLYCVSLKLALAFWQMKKNKTITPIVIDDVFDASDFENSLKLEKFVYEIYRAYAMMAGREGIIIPLQLIVLTHDQLMKTSFERGLARYRIESSLEERKLMSPASCICGRLLPVKDISKATNDGLIQAYESFYNLYIQL